MNGPWKINKTKNIPPQREGLDCGLFMLMYALYIALDWTFDFSQDDIPQLRRWFALHVTSKVVRVHHHQTASKYGNCDGSR
ncbi:sentrin-specific protease 5-like [Carassius auratus]|uniref:Sentrin-specific protease 5-like n=1 Tax=Carassius auratus TaxID=7957 RepID=A0A6P6NJ13_CARAU|nr:sentrin-specific protease 5-like [Carassius auratus]XP_026108456.1 sentrin-specific protease 5-like [Carassius auratus]XP_026108459.1 sentrin-specific protease 5-like [Carassius auratus]